MSGKYMYTGIGINLEIAASMPVAVWWRNITISPQVLPHTHHTCLSLPPLPSPPTTIPCRNHDVATSCVLRPYHTWVSCPGNVRPQDFYTPTPTPSPHPPIVPGGGKYLARVCQHLCYSNHSHISASTGLQLHQTIKWASKYVYPLLSYACCLRKQLWMASGRGGWGGGGVYVSLPSTLCRVINIHVDSVHWQTKEMETQTIVWVNVCGTLQVPVNSGGTSCVAFHTHCQSSTATVAISNGSSLGYCYLTAVMATGIFLQPCHGTLNLS